MNSFQAALESCYRHEFADGLVHLLRESSRYGTALRKHCSLDTGLPYCAAVCLWNIEEEWEFFGCHWTRFDWGLDKEQKRLVHLALATGKGKTDPQIQAFLELASLFYERK